MCRRSTLGTASFVSIELSRAGFEYDNLTVASNDDVPGALPLFGFAAAFGWSRRMRHRIGKGH
jgi:MYXO-CTERM domain-containing protein